VAGEAELLDGVVQYDERDCRTLREVDPWLAVTDQGGGAGSGYLPYFVGGIQPLARPAADRQR
jgi:hypothetical protein